MTVKLLWYVVRYDFNFTSTLLLAFFHRDVYSHDSTFAGAC